jgi:hypothetical protein
MPRLSSARQRASFDSIGDVFVGRVASRIPVVEASKVDSHNFGQSRPAANVARIKPVAITVTLPPPRGDDDEFLSYIAAGFSPVDTKQKNIIKKDLP